MSSKKIVGVWVLQIPFGKYYYLQDQNTFERMVTETRKKENKAGYTTILVTCGWAGAVLEKVTRSSGQEP